jgi:hypothetical protein
MLIEVPPKLVGSDSPFSASRVPLAKPVPKRLIIESLAWPPFAKLAAEIADNPVPPPGTLRCL